MLMARLVTTGKAAGRCPAGSASWGEIWRWRSWGSHPTRNCWAVSPMVFVVQWGGGQELNPVPLGTGEVCGTRAFSPYLAWVILSLCDTGRTNPGIRAVLVILAWLADEQILESSAHHRATEPEAQHRGLDVPPG